MRTGGLPAPAEVFRLLDDCPPPTPGRTHSINNTRQGYRETLSPVWAVWEVMSLGLLSRCNNNLKPMPARRAIATVYGVDGKVLESWLRHLSPVRNTCAHHRRLWNREFTTTPQLPLNKPTGLAAQLQPDSRNLYSAPVVLLHDMDVIAPGHPWWARVKALIAEHWIPVAAMDFPAEWEEMAIWQEKTA